MKMERGWETSEQAREKIAYRAKRVRGGQEMQRWGWRENMGGGGMSEQRFTARMTHGAGVGKRRGGS
jgi:hypothetical protein